MLKLFSGHILVLWAIAVAVVIGQEASEELPAPTALRLSNSDGNTLVHLAAQRGDEVAALSLLKSNSNLSALNDQLHTPLHTAALRAADTCSSDPLPCLNITKLLIEAGSNLYLKDRDNCTFLHLLLWPGTTLSPSQFKDIAEFLISLNHTALFNVPGEDSVTPLQLAVQAVEVPIHTLNLLYLHGAIFSAVDADGDSVLSHALTGCRLRSWPFLNKLIRFGSDVKHLNSRNDNFLHRAAYCGSRNTLHLFIQYHLNVNALNDRGNSPLHLVVDYAKKEILGCVKLLLDNGADIQAKNTDGLTPFDIAEERPGFPDREKVLQLLKPKQDNVSSTTTPGTTTSFETATAESGEEPTAATMATEATITTTISSSLSPTSTAATTTTTTRPKKSGTSKLTSSSVGISLFLVVFHSFKYLGMTV